MLNSSVQAASTAVSTHGRYSGLQPAITAAMATFSTVTSTRSGGTVATMSDGAPAGAREHAHHAFLRRRHDRQPVGPSAVEHHLHLVLGVGDVDAARAEHAGAEPHPQRVDEIRVDAHRSASGPHLGQPGRRDPSTPVTRSQSGRYQPDRPFDARRRRRRCITVGTVSISWCQLTDKLVVVHRHRVIRGTTGSSCVKTVSCAVASSSRSTGTIILQVSHSCLTTTTIPSGSAVGDVGDGHAWNVPRRPRRGCDRRHVARTCERRRPHDVTCGPSGDQSSPVAAHRRHARHLSRRARFDPVPRSRHRALRREHVVRVGRRAGPQADRVRPRHGPALLRPDALGRRAALGHLSAEPSPLGSHPGSAVLQAAAAATAPTCTSTRRSRKATSRSSRSSPTRSSRRCSRSTSRCCRA